MPQRRRPAGHGLSKQIGYSLIASHQVAMPGSTGESELESEPHPGANSRNASKKPVDRKLDIR